jgi:hypothetical protein
MSTLAASKNIPLKQNYGTSDRRICGSTDFADQCFLFLYTEYLFFYVKTGNLSLFLTEAYIS